MAVMNDVQIGIRFRALRQRRGWRQEDLADRAGVSQDVVSRIERGRLENVPLAKLRRVAAALDADFVLLLRWHGGDLDRLTDEGHAHLVGRVIELLKAGGWQVRTEVSYSIYGERGSIDVLAWHPGTRTLLVVEVKTELVSVEETIRKHDEKARLAARIAAEQLGWTAAAVARILVLPDRSTPRRHVDRHRSVLDAAYPVRGMAVRRWLEQSVGGIAGILWLDPGTGVDSRPLARKRIRRSMARRQPSAAA